MSKPGNTRSQRGLSLIFALLALVALSVASVALIRSIDTSTLVLGNLGYKQETTALAEQGTQEAIRWLDQQAGNDTAPLENAIEGVALYAATATAIQTPEAQLPLVDSADRDDVEPDAPGNGQCAITVAEGVAAGNPCPPGNELFIFGPAPNGQGTVLLGNVRYSITRLCRNVGSAEGNDCVRPASQVLGSPVEKNSVSAADTGADRLIPATSTLYRVVVRAQGARDTTTYTETIVQR